ncbi:Pycsar system effector family protein [Streptomyces sp. NPDC014802]|uniref:Pycsar system effector family protein n=1 Tax=Streptomyces sp. NPDC014802 TaxID=3364917 RepID=UPI0036FE1709
MTRVFGALAVFALGAAAVLLLLVVWPPTRRPRPGAILARLAEAEIQACMDIDARAARVRVLSGNAVAKFTQLRRAVDLTLLSHALLGLAAAGLAA